MPSGLGHLCAKAQAGDWENVGLRIVNGSGLCKLKNVRATMKHDEATRGTKALLITK